MSEIWMHIFSEDNYIIIVLNVLEGGSPLHIGATPDHVPFLRQSLLKAPTSL